MISWLAGLRISTKLRLMFIALSCGLIASMVSIYAVIEFQSLRGELSGQYSSIARMISRSGRAAITFADAGEAQRLVEGAFAGQQVIGVVITDSFGEILAARVTAPRMTAAEIIETSGRSPFVFSNAGSIAYEPVLLDGERVGEIFVVGNNSALEAEKTKLFWMIAGALLTTMLASMVFSVPLERLLAVPIARLAREMESLSQDGDYSRRMEVAGADEVADLYGRFNTMLEEIESRDRHIDGERMRLEYEVRSRTADLREINQELERHVEELRLANEAANSAARTKSEFLANMSHEIRTPMNGVLGMLDLVRESPLSSDQRDHIEMAYHSGQGLLTIINDILDISKIEAGKMTIVAEPASPANLIEEVCGVLQHQATARAVELVTLIEPAGWEEFELDPTRLRQVLLNLVGNAIKFTHQGSVSVACTVIEQSSQLTLVVDVIDTGIGIPPEAQQRLFEAFTQADGSTTRKYGGTGLGLTITRQLIHLMGGEISLSSIPDAGSTFSFRFPVAAAPLAARIAGSSKLGKLSVGLNLSSGLLERSVRHMFAYLDPALELVAPHTAEVVITDIEAMEPIDSRQRLVVLAPKRAPATDRRIYVPRPTRIKPLLQAVLGDRDPSGDIPEPRQLLSYPTAEVLLVEDNQINQMVASRMLLRFGIRCEIEADGLAAFARVQEHKFDLIIMDCQMPEMDGFECTACIRRWEQESAARRTPIVALTANAMEGDAQRCLDAGMSDYLAKPIDTDRLGEALERWLGTTSVQAAAMESAKR